MTLSSGDNAIAITDTTEGVLTPAGDRTILIPYDLPGDGSDAIRIHDVVGNEVLALYSLPSNGENVFRSLDTARNNILSFVEDQTDPDPDPDPLPNITTRVFSFQGDDLITSPPADWDNIRAQCDAQTVLEEVPRGAVGWYSTPDHARLNRGGRIVGGGDLVGAGSLILNYSVFNDAGEGTQTFKLLTLSGADGTETFRNQIAAATGAAVLGWDVIQEISCPAGTSLGSVDVSAYIPDGSPNDQVAFATVSLPDYNDSGYPSFEYNGSIDEIQHIEIDSVKAYA